MSYRIRSTGRWVAQGRDASGKRIQLGTYTTKRDADKAEAAHKRRGPRGDLTVAEWRERWLDTPEWKDSTRTHNTERTRSFALSHGTKKLSAITRTIARDHVRDFPSTHGALSAMFGAAMYEDGDFGEPLLTFNPFSKLVRRSQRKRDLQAEWLTAVDVQAIEDVARGLFNGWGHVAAAIVRFAAETGVRPGELFALEHDDLRYGEGVLVVGRAVDSKTRRVTVPKNGQTREIVLSVAAAEAALAASSEGRIFSSPRGQQLWNTSWLYYWHQIRAAAGRPDMAFYELRHYCATRLLEAGLSDRDVAEQLGHSDGGELVRRVYGHPSKRQALKRVREALGG